MTLDFEGAVRDLRTGIGDFLARHTAEGIFHAALGGPGSVPDLSDLAPPELHLDFQGIPSARGLAALGYRETLAGWEHPHGWRLVFAEEGSGWLAEQAALQALLLSDAGARAQYRRVFEAQGREAADTALREAASDLYAQQVGFAPAGAVAALFAEMPDWMFAAGMALDLHLGRVTRPHEDLDVIVPRSEQEHLRPLLRGWRLDAAIGGEYHAWTEPLTPPHFQIHARREHFPLMLDLMLTDFESGQWVYRRDPHLKLPLSEARRFTAAGWPYLAPQAVLLFKAGRGGQPRPKDEADFQRVLPALTPAERDWLREALTHSFPQHPWLRSL